MSTSITQDWTLLLRDKFKDSGITMFPLDKLEWISQVTTSADLSGIELADLAESEKAFKEGKGKRFKDAKSLLESLEKDEEED